MTAVGPGPMDTPFFYGQEEDAAVAYHKTALSPFSKTGLTDIEDVVPFILHLVTDGWWITGQTLLINGGYTTKQMPTSAHLVVSRRAANRRLAGSPGARTRPECRT